MMELSCAVLLLLAGDSLSDLAATDSADSPEPGCLTSCPSACISTNTHDSIYTTAGVECPVGTG